MGEINDLGGICSFTVFRYCNDYLKVMAACIPCASIIYSSDGAGCSDLSVSHTSVISISWEETTMQQFWSAGTCGFGMGATPNAMANMQAICDRYAPSVKAYLLIPLVGSLFADFINSLVITFFINLL